MCYKAFLHGQWNSPSIRAIHSNTQFLFFQGIYVTRVTEGGPAEVAGLQIGDKIMQVNSKLRRVPIQYQVHASSKLLLGKLLSSGYFLGQFVQLTNKQSCGIRVIVPDILTRHL